MTNKEIAQRLDAMLEHKVGSFQLGEEIIKLRDELDPPRPQPGTVVWWRYKYAGGPEYKYIGIVEDYEEGIYDAGGCFRANQDIQCKPARIAGPMQVIFDIPTVGEWPAWAESIEWRFIGGPATVRNRPIVTRAEAERMEAEE